MGTQFGRTFLGSNMKSFTVDAILCMSASCLGAPQGNNPRSLFSFTKTNSYDSFGLPTTGKHITNQGAQGPSWNLNFAKIPFSGKNFMSPEERAEQLPVMKALIKVMETDKPDPADVNELLVLTRDLQKNGLNNGKAGFLGGFGAGIGLAGIEGMGLPETGGIIENVDGEPHINTQFGQFPLSDTSLMSEEQRKLFLPASKTFLKVLEQDKIDPDTMNELLAISRELALKIPKTTKNGGLFGGIGSSLGLAAAAPAAIGGGAGIPAFVRSASGSSADTKYDNFLLPESGDHIINVPGQGPSFNTKIGKFPVGENIMSAQERARFLPVMKALLKVMETKNAAPSDVNNLLILTRDLQKYAPADSANFGGFANFEGIEGMGIPQEGDVIQNIGGQPHIMTNFGAFPLSDVSLMTDAERQQFLPSVRTFISVLEKDNLDASEMNTLLAQSRELTNLIPSNLLNQFGGGLNGLAGFGK